MESTELSKIVSHRKTTCKKFVKKVKANLKQQATTSDQKSEREIQALRNQFANLARSSKTYGSSFFYGMTLKGFNSLIAVNASGIHVIIKPNSAQSELRFSCNFDNCAIKLNERGKPVPNAEVQTNGQLSFTVAPLPGSKTPFPPVTLFSAHSKLIVTLANALTFRKPKTSLAGRDQREVNFALSPLVMRSNSAAYGGDNSGVIPLM